MTKLEVFNTLCDCVTDLERHVWYLPHRDCKMALEALIERFDALVDHVLTMTEELQETDV